MSDPMYCIKHDTHYPLNGSCPKCKVLRESQAPAKLDPAVVGILRDSVAIMERNFQTYITARGLAYGEAARLIRGLYEERK